MTRHLLDEVLDRRAAREAAAANPVITWLRSPAGEAWSRIAHSGGATRPESQPQTIWRPGGLLNGRHDPCGRPPEKSRNAPGRQP